MKFIRLHIYNGYRSNDLSLRTSVGTLVQVINNTFYWLVIIIYRPKFVDWSTTFLKIFFISYLIGASITANIWKIISKRMSWNKENL